MFCLWLLCRSAIGFVRCRALRRHSRALYRSQQDRIRRRKPSVEDAGDARELDAEEAPQAGNQSLHVLHTRNVCRRICTQARGGRLVCSLEYHIGEESSPSLSTTITVQRALGTIRFANRAPGGTGRQHGRIYAICKDCWGRCKGHTYADTRHIRAKNRPTRKEYPQRRKIRLSSLIAESSISCHDAILHPSTAAEET